MFVLNPNEYLLPAYGISPFSSHDLTKNCEMVADHTIDLYFQDRFNSNNYAYFYNGSAAINKSLSHYNLNKEDVITILTTSENFYISSCVTKEIEKFCQWSREITTKTKILFVNHEFGYPYEKLGDLKEMGYPIIEDCAHTFFSEDKNSSIGTIGDFVIYSFPKMFPIQIGGLLRSNLNMELDKNGTLESERLNYLKNVISYYIHNEKKIIKKRLDNYHYLAEKFIEMGCIPYFELSKGVVPGVFLFKIGKRNIDLTHFKAFMNNHGIQSSVFYGKHAYFIPVHQNLTKGDLDYFVFVVEQYLCK